MKLSAYLEQNNLTPAEFGRKVDASRSAVCRWLKGERKPTKHMPKIIEVTRGKVRPNDFYEAA